MIEMTERALPDVIVPLRFGSLEECKSGMLEFNRKYGFTRFCLTGLGKGFRNIGYPKREDYLSFAERFAEVREWATGEGLSLGWFCALTVKSGKSGFTPVICTDGSVHPFSNCPLDEDFRDLLASDIAEVARVGKPDFIFVEDDFSVTASRGCYCPAHLKEFGRRMGREYSREEILAAIERDDPRSMEIHRAFRELKKDSLVGLAQRIGQRIGEVSPETPIGLMQSGGVDRDGGFTEEVACALAGGRHKPYVRLYGTEYCGFVLRHLPGVLFHALVGTQSFGDRVICYHETDTYPHSRYYTSGKHAMAMMYAAYSYGMVGSIFFARQFHDEPKEEDAYGKAYAREAKKLARLVEYAQKCSPSGVQLCFDSFYNTLESKNPAAYFAEPLARFGIPYTTNRSSVAFWDERQAKYASRERVMDALSRGLFLDGDAAKILTERGFSEYLGVSAGKYVLEENPSLVNDLGCREVTCDGITEEGEGRNMPAAHAYCPKGNGKWVILTPLSDKTEVLSEGFDFPGNRITSTMTYFENSLGGKVAVMSLTVKDNPSQALYNYRRQRSLRRIIDRISPEFPMVVDAPEVFNIYLTPKEEGELLAVLTLINLSEDDGERVEISLPEKLSSGRAFEIGRDGELHPLNCEKTKLGVRLVDPLLHSDPRVIVIKK